MSKFAAIGVTGFVFALALGCGDTEPGAKASAGEAGDGTGATQATAGSSSGGGGGSNGGTSGGGKPGTGSGSLDDWLADYAKALCAVFARCWQSFDDALPPGETCAASIERSLRQSSLSELQAAVDDGRVDYHAESAATCLDQIANASCEGGLTFASEACGQMLVGKVPAGAACTTDAECANAGQCLVDGDGSCPGTCGPRYQENEACTSHNRCEEGLLCMISSDQSGVCAKPVPSGGACNSSTSCGTFEYCRVLDALDPEATGTCEPRDSLYQGALDEACSLGGPEGLCEPGLVCVLGERGRDIVGTCQPKVEPGSACQYSLPDPCPTGQFCRIDDDAVMPLVGTCTKNPQLGETCRYGQSLLASCPPAQHCNLTSGKCDPSLSLGETCAEDQDCLSGYCIESQCGVLLECELN